MYRFAFALLLSLFLRPSFAVNPELAPTAPADKPSTWDSAAERAMAPLILQAKASYPQAKQRFLAGLPKGQSFFITTRLRDVHGRREQVFVAVDSIQDGLVKGRIWSPILHVEGFHYRDLYAFPEAELVDWLISKPDGTEEGNVVGKFMDTYQGAR